MTTDQKFRAARLWSNRELRRIAPLVSGDVVNVSGADDIDKEGSRYSTYFPSAKSYTVTNFDTEIKGFKGRSNEILLDLESPVGLELRKRFDVAFNHTTLEHVFDVETAFSNLCDLARDYVVIVVPFAQVEHGGSVYGDYWRFTPMALQELFHRRGWHVPYLTASPMRHSAIYLFAVGAATRELAANVPSASRPPEPVGDWIGTSAIHELRRLGPALGHRIRSYRLGRSA